MLFGKICVSIALVFFALVIAVFFLCMGVENREGMPKGFIKWVYERTDKMCVIFGAASAFFFIISLVSIVWR